jgi:signal transduction histidine kinase
MLVSVVIFILSLGFFYERSRNLIREEAMIRANSVLTTTMKRVNKYMGAVENAARSNAWLLEENFTPDSLQAISHRIVMRNHSIVSCTVGTEPDMFPQIGRYFSVYTVNDSDTIYTVRETEYDYINKKWYKKARSTNKACWVSPFSDFIDAELDHSDAVASFCMPLHTSNGRIAGIVSTDFSFTSLAKIIQNNELPYPSAYFMLLGSDGRYLIHPNTDILFKKTIFSDTDANIDADLIALGHEMTDGRSGITHVTIDNNYCCVCYSSIKGTDWSLALVFHDDEILSSYNYLGIVIIVLIIVGVLVIQWLCYRVVRQTINPIKQLLDKTDKITNGQYDDLIPLSDRNDAVAQLQNSFSAMQQSILSHIGQIERTAQEIDKYNVDEDDKVEKAEEAIRRKNLFMSHVLYQVRKPLDVIQECANTLRDSMAIPDKELQDLTEKLKYQTNALRRMLFMLFDSSDTQVSNIAMYNPNDMVSCNQVVRDCIEYIHDHFTDETIRLETEVPDDFQVQTNYLYLMRSMREVLYNAARYSDGQHILVRITQTPNTVRFTIEDVGPGLPSGTACDLIFKPFMKVDNLSEGLGLGLPLSKRHLTRIGGELIYDADYKEGCRIILEVPKQPTKK